MTDTPARPRKTTLSGQHRYGRQARGALISMRCFRPRRCRPGLRGRSARPAWALPGGYGTSANNCAASMGTFTAPTRRGGRSSIRESCLTRCPLLRTGRAWAAVVGCARSLDGPLRLVRTSICMAAPTPSLQWCIPRRSTSLAGRKVRSAMTTTDVPPLQVTPQCRRDNGVRHDDQYEQAA